jgi:hypothetical protein
MQRRQEKKIFAKKIADKMGKKKPAADDTEAGLLSPSDSETPVEDRGAVLRPELGRAPSDVRRVPRSKISAELDSMFEEIREPNLSGADAGEVQAANPMRKLVASLLGKSEDTKDGK